MIQTLQLPLEHCITSYNYTAPVLIGMHAQRYTSVQTKAEKCV